MRDLWSRFNELEASTQQVLAATLETRGADPEQQAMRGEFLAAIRFPDRARVLEVGCGTGVLTRQLARRPNVATVVGVDPARLLIEKARTLAAGLTNLEFRQADGAALPFGEGSFDVVLFDSVLSHVLEPERLLGEAVRVLSASGQLAIFEGDYSTMTVALCEGDPLQACADAVKTTLVHDRWIVRRLPDLVRRRGLALEQLHGHGFVDDGSGGYMLTVVDRGAALLEARGLIDERGKEALQAEARRRITAGTFFGHVAYASLTARKDPT